LILGLLSFFVIPILGPVAIMVANGVLREDRNDGSAQVGWILGWISTIFCILGACVLAAIITSAMSAVNR
jgi:hypothetical protein